ncbi:MAG: tRNA lysidine(34) synthetase TilS [Nitriliruptorales bacterium]|nr:tRNA lysidine(34) synthetase TilS [Nitriliruptorales bacterium]
MAGALPRGQPERALVGEVRAVLECLPAGATTLVAASGGADSAALALLARRARPDLHLVVVHVRHGLRDDAADAAAAAALARALDCDFVERKVTVTPGGRGMEAAARQARYHALREVARKRDAAAVLVGHTADDQAETVLLALGRGTGTGGLGGMRPVRHEGSVAVIRPLLRLRRAEIRAAAAAAGLRTVEDPTNADPDQRRRRARTEVLPAMAGLSGGDGDTVGLLTRLAELARADADLLEDLAAAEVVRLVRSWGPVRVVPAGEVRALPTALARRVVRDLLAGVRGGRSGLDAAAIDRVLVLHPGGEVQVAGGVRVTANGGWLAAAPRGLGDLPARPLPVPGTVALPEVGLAVHAEMAGSAQPADPLSGSAVLPPRAVIPRGADGGAEALLDVPAGVALVVRARRPGDPVPGAPHRRLGDRLTDLGVPRALRGLLPVIAALGGAGPGSGVDRGAPLWVPGIAVHPSPAAAAQGVRLRLVPLHR